MNIHWSIFVISFCLSCPTLMSWCPSLSPVLALHCASLHYMLWHLQQVFVPTAVSLGLHIHQGQLYTMEGIFIILSHWVIMYHQGVLERGLAKQFVHNLLHQSRLRGADVNEWKSNSVVQHLDCSWVALTPSVFRLRLFHSVSQVKSVCLDLSHSKWNYHFNAVFIKLSKKYDQGS